MTQRELLLEMFKNHGNCLTLGQIMQTTLAAEYRARFTELRHEGFTISLERGKKASDNLYRLVHREPVKYEIEPSGQMRIAI